MSSFLFLCYLRLDISSDILPVPRSLQPISQIPFDSIACVLKHKRSHCLSPVWVSFAVSQSSLTTTRISSSIFFTSLFFSLSHFPQTGDSPLNRQVQPASGKQASGSHPICHLRSSFCPTAPFSAAFVYALGRLKTYTYICCCLKVDPLTSPDAHVKPPSHTESSRGAWPHKQSSRAQDSTSKAAKDEKIWPQTPQHIPKENKQYRPQTRRLHRRQRVTSLSVQFSFSRS